MINEVYLTIIILTKLLYSNKIYSLSMIQLKTYNLLLEKNEILLNHEVLSIYINKFWDEVFNTIKDSHLLILCKIKFIETESEMGHRTLGHLVKVNFEDKELFIDYLSQRLSILSDSYMSVPISQISFSYIVKDGKCLDDERTLLIENYEKKDNIVHNFNNMNLPITMDPFKYGNIEISNIIKEKDEIFERFIIVKDNKTFRIDVYDGGKVNKISILGNIKLSWIDTRLDEN